jgi:ribosomal protein L7/L12
MDIKDVKVGLTVICKGRKSNDDYHAEVVSLTNKAGQAMFDAQNRQKVSVRKEDGSVVQVTAENFEPIGISASAKEQVRGKIKEVEVDPLQERFLEALSAAKLTPATAEMFQQWKEGVVSLQKLEAVKFTKKLFGCGLKEAKEIVDFMGINETITRTDPAFTDIVPPTSTPPVVDGKDNFPEWASTVAAREFFIEFRKTHPCNARIRDWERACTKKAKQLCAEEESLETAILKYYTYSGKPAPDAKEEILQFWQSRPAKEGKEPSSGAADKVGDNPEIVNAPPTPSNVPPTPSVAPIAPGKERTIIDMLLIDRSYSMGQCPYGGTARRFQLAMTGTNNHLAGLLEDANKYEDCCTTISYVATFSGQQGYGLNQATYEVLLNFSKITGQSLAPQFNQNCFQPKGESAIYGATAKALKDLETWMKAEGHTFENTSIQLTIFTDGMDTCSLFPQKTDALLRSRNNPALGICVIFDEDSRMWTEKMAADFDMKAGSLMSYDAMMAEEFARVFDVLRNARRRATEAYCIKGSVHPQYFD